MIISAVISAGLRRRPSWPELRGAEL